MHAWGSQGYLWRVVSKIYVITLRKHLHPGSVERYDILERNFDISDNIQGKFRNISYEIVLL
jgi:hypothetical protein